MMPARGPQTIIILAIITRVAVMHAVAVIILIEIIPRCPYVSMGVHKCRYVFMCAHRSSSKNF